MGKNNLRLKGMSPPWQPPPQASLLMQQLKKRLEQEMAQKTQILLVLLALVKSTGGEASFPTDQGVVPQDKLHFRIEQGVTTLTYEAAGAQAPAPSSEAPPPPPQRKIWLPGDPTPPPA